MEPIDTLLKLYQYDFSAFKSAKRVIIILSHFWTIILYEFNNLDIDFIFRANEQL